MLQCIAASGLNEPLVISPQMGKICLPGMQMLQSDIELLVVVPGDVGCLVKPCMYQQATYTVSGSGSVLQYTCQECMFTNFSFAV